MKELTIKLDDTDQRNLETVRGILPPFPNGIPDETVLVASLRLLADGISTGRINPATLKSD